MRDVINCLENPLQQQVPMWHGLSDWRNDIEMNINMRESLLRHRQLCSIRYLPVVILLLAHVEVSYGKVRNIKQFGVAAAAPGAAGGTEVAPNPVQNVKSDSGKTTHGCSFTSTDGWVYDLSPLTKPDGVEDYHVRFEKQQYSLTLNICSNVDKTKLEPSCKQHLQNGELSPVYQTNDPGKSCYYLGNVDKPKWEVMDTTNPRKGVVLTYTDGQQCGVRGKRSVSYHMVCANNFLSFEPPSFAYESPVCHYNIVWPTIHACPTSVTGPRFIHFVLACVIIYFVFRTAYNKFLLGIDGLEAIPHLSVIQRAFYVLLDMLDFIKGLIPGLKRNTQGGMPRRQNNAAADDNVATSEQDSLMMDGEDLKPMKIGTTDL